MDYSLIGILALLMLLISDHDVLFKKRAELAPAMAAYRDFLLTVMFFYVTDILWGILWTLSLATPLFIDTELYFVAMALGIMFLTRYAAAYMENKSGFRMLLLTTGMAFCIGVVILIVVNIFFPLMFRIDEAAEYYPGAARYVTLGFQIVMLLLTSVYAFYGAGKAAPGAKKRYRTLALFGLVMLLAISIQMIFPLMPMYAIGYMLGCALMRSFIVENEKEESRADMERALRREKQQSKELKTAWRMAYTDALTGVQNKLAYLEKEDRINENIADGTLSELAMVVFDVNDLKKINDTFGHQTGDKQLIAGSALIREYFKTSSVFRIGGDEFIAILEGQDYVDRQGILAAFYNRIIANTADGSIVIAFGVAEFVRGSDKTCRQIVERADALMYEQKEVLKKLSRPFAGE